MQLNAKGTHNRLTTVVSKCQFLITSALRSHLLWSLSYGNIPGMFGCDKHVIAVHSRASEKDPLLELGLQTASGHYSEMFNSMHPIG